MSKCQQTNGPGFPGRGIVARADCAGIAAGYCGPFDACPLAIGAAPYQRARADSGQQRVRIDGRGLTHAVSISGQIAACRGHWAVSMHAPGAGLIGPGGRGRAHNRSGLTFPASI